MLTVAPSPTSSTWASALPCSPSASAPRGSARRAIGAAMLVLGIALGLAGTGVAKVFYSKDEALHAAFPDAETIEKETLFLTDEQSRQVEGLAKVRLESKMITVHTGRRDQKVVGYAMIDIHIVRTQPEAVMVVLSPDGT